MTKLAIQEHQNTVYYDQSLFRKCMLVENCFQELENVLRDYFNEINDRLDKFIIEELKQDKFCTETIIKEFLREYILNEHLQQLICVRISNTFKKLKINVNELNSVFTNQKATLEISLQQIISVVRESKTSIQTIKIAEKCYSEAVDMKVSGLGIPGFANKALKHLGLKEALKDSLDLNIEEQKNRSGYIIYKMVSGILENAQYRLYDDLTYIIACKAYGVNGNDPDKTDPANSHNQFNRYAS